MIDDFVGRILSELEQSGDRDNTVVILTSDHGDFAGNHRLLFKNAFLYDDLLRVPLIISWPARFQPGVIDALVEEIDVAATMLRLGGLEVHQGVQGEDLLPLIDGKVRKVRDAAYAEAVSQRSIRTREWKLVHYQDKPYGELYNLVSDPHELVNLYDDPAYAHVRAELRAILVDRMTSLDEKLHSPVSRIALEDHRGPGQPPLTLPYI
mgnify:CR=1 FL=1|jgi:arylsulfatase A-like enzyme